jgi:hypothetical protein
MVHYMFVIYYEADLIYLNAFSVAPSLLKENSNNVLFHSTKANHKNDDIYKILI